MHNCISSWFKLGEQHTLHCTASEKIWLAKQITDTFKLGNLLYPMACSIFSPIFPLAKINPYIVLIFRKVKYVKYFIIFSIITASKHRTLTHNCWILFYILFVHFSHFELNDTGFFWHLSGTKFQYNSSVFIYTVAYWGLKMAPLLCQGYNKSHVFTSPVDYYPSWHKRFIIKL